MKKIKVLVAMNILFISSIAHAQSSRTSGKQIDNFTVNDASHPCISNEEYTRMENEILKNQKLLGLNNLSNKELAAASLQWPLKSSASLNDCSYYTISAYVDLDNTAGIKDWNCGTRTYNGHRGIDIVMWPFGWDKMDNNSVESIAAASGTIIAKVDGNPDRVCNGVGGGSNSNNYITIQHADGSQALYVHLKTGSMTSKTVGQKVVTGEFLGIPGSAGQSTGVHLHFEIRKLGTFASYIDPYFGACNGSIGASWWVTQKPYTEPQIVKLSTHFDWPIFASCPNTNDTPNTQDTFFTGAGAEAIFHACTRNVTAGMTWNFEILNPNNSVFDSWTYTSTLTLNTSILGWSRTLPTVPGTYTFNGTFNGVACSKPFTIQASLSTNQDDFQNKIHLYPNPTSGKLFLKMENLSILNSEILIFDTLGKLIRTAKIATSIEEIELNFQSGIYFYKIVDEAKTTLKSGKLIVK